MAACDVSIRVKESGPFRPGDHVRGSVVVTVHRDVSPRTVRVSLGWQTSGRGEFEAGDPVQLELPGGEWTAGSVIESEFELALPQVGPATYSGKLVGVNWRVAAELDLPMALDAKGETEVIVVPAEAAPPGRLTDASVTSPAVRGTMGIPVLILAAVALAGASLSWKQIALQDWRGAAAAAVAATLFGLLALWALFKNVGRRALAGAVVTCKPASVSAGETVAVALVTPKNPRMVEAVTAHLVCREWARYRSGGKHKTWRTETHELHKSDFVMYPADGAWTGEVTLPADVVNSFATSYSAVQWRVELEAKVRRAGDVSLRGELAVRRITG